MCDISFVNSSLFTKEKIKVLLISVSKLLSGEFIMFKRMLVSVIKKYFVYLKKAHGNNLQAKMPSHNLS